jgi:hypothetical protein
MSDLLINVVTSQWFLATIIIPLIIGAWAKVPGPVRDFVQPILDALKTSSELRRENVLEHVAKTAVLAAEQKVPRLAIANEQQKFERNQEALRVAIKDATSMGIIDPREAEIRIEAAVAEMKQFPILREIELKTDKRLDELELERLNHQPTE